MDSNSSMKDSIKSTNGYLGQSKDVSNLSPLLSGGQPPYSPFVFDEKEHEINDAECDRNFIRNGVRGYHESPDALVAYELNQLSFEERVRLANDIHGIQPVSIQEEPQLLSTSLEQLSIELDSIPKKNKTAYEISQTFPKTYVNTKEFRLIFLRCECFDARKAAQRIVCYLDVIRWAFGEEVLERDLRLSDLDGRTLQYLKAGLIQVLPGRDRSGRRIAGNFSFAAHQSIYQTLPAVNRIRGAIYMKMAMARDNIDVQKRGVVGLFWALYDIPIEDFKIRSIVHTTLIKCTPLRYCSLHICLHQASNNLMQMATKTMYFYAIGPQYRKRLRVHVGSSTECIYALQTFGIQPHHMPINTKTGRLKTEYNEKWMGLQGIRDGVTATNKSLLRIECPEQIDILLGRGWPKMGHPGNAIFRNLIETRMADYNNSRSKREKTTIAWSVVFELNKNRVRFLREDKSGGWVEVSNEIAREKVSIGFRDIRKAQTKSTKRDIAKSKRGEIGHVLSSQQDNTIISPNIIKGEQEMDSFAFLDMDGSRNKSMFTTCMNSIRPFNDHAMNMSLDTYDSEKHRKMTPDSV